MTFVSLTEDNGVSKKIIKVGIASLDDESNKTASPQKNSKVSVHYVGRLESNGEEFDSSRARGQPFEFTLGVGQVIKGWDIGVASMKRGELAELRCEANYAYGAAGSPPKIPENSTLIFEVELLDWEEPEPEDVQGKIMRASECKLNGNNFLKEGNYSSAVACYEKASKLLKNVNDWELVKEEAKEERKSLLVSVLSNLSLCQFKQGQHAAVITTCRKALLEDLTSLPSIKSKLLFRLGSSLGQQGSLDEAQKALSEALELSPQDQSIVAAISNVKQLQLAYKEKEKRLYANMFKSS